MRDASRRDLIVLDTLVRSDPSHVASRPLLDLVERIAKLHMARKAAYWRNNKTRKIYLGQISFAPNRSFAALLIKCTTGNLPDEYFADLKTDEERLVEMLEGEGKQESVHLLLSLVSDPQEHHRYYAVLEGGDVLTRGLVQDYVNYLLRKVGQDDARSFSCPSPDGACDSRGRPKRNRYHSEVQLQGHLADSFRSDLENGRLTGIELIKSLSDGTGAAEGRYIRSSRRTLRLKSKTTWKENAMASLAESIGMAKQEQYDRLRVAFTSTDRMSHHVDIDPVTENVIGDAFVKRVRIGPFEQLKPLACSAFDLDILTPMVGQLNAQLPTNARAASVDGLIERKAPNSDLVSDTEAVQLPDYSRRAEELL